MDEPAVASVAGDGWLSSVIEGGEMRGWNGMRRKLGGQRGFDRLELEVDRTTLGLSMYP